MGRDDAIVPVENIQSMIFTVRGVQVMVDRDLARIYGVEIKRLTEQVKRNIDRFPENFRFQLTKDECENLRSQIGASSFSDESLRSQSVTLESNSISLRSQFATLKTERGRGQHRKYLPYVFTEQFTKADKLDLPAEALAHVADRAVGGSAQAGRLWAIEKGNNHE